MTLLTTFPIDSYLDLPAYRGQRVDRYRFALINGTTDAFIRFLQPERDEPPTLTHDTTQSIKRRMTIKLNEADTAAITPLTDRIIPYMIVGGITYQLGRYMFTSEIDAFSTGGERSSCILFDEGFIVDQQLEKGFSSVLAVSAAITALLTGLPLVGMTIEPTTFLATGGFNAGQTRGQALAAYATQGDYFPYWMDNTGFFRMKRTRDPGREVPDFDFDVGNKVVRDGVSFTSDVLTAPNRFIAISNANAAKTTPMVGMYDVPASAPYSIAQRGFVIPQVDDVQVTTQAQAIAAARNIGIRQTVFERCTLSTANDPRHDSYNVVRFNGVNWLELAWAMTLTPGGDMMHMMRKAYV